MDVSKHTSRLLRGFPKVVDEPPARTLTAEIVLVHTASNGALKQPYGGHGGKRPRRKRVPRVQRLRRFDQEPRAANRIVHTFRKNAEKMSQTSTVFNERPPTWEVETIALSYSVREHLFDVKFRVERYKLPGEVAPACPGGARGRYSSSLPLSPRLQVKHPRRGPPDVTNL